MSPEEFDNRLRASFKDEYLPPKEQMWQNISTRLDQKPSASVWHWVAPVIIAVVVGLAWIGNAFLSKKSENSAPVSTVSSLTDSGSSSSISSSVSENKNQSSDNHAASDNSQSTSEGIADASNSGKSSETSTTSSSLKGSNTGGAGLNNSGTDRSNKHSLADGSSNNPEKNPSKPKGQREKSRDHNRPSGNASASSTAAPVFSENELALGAFALIGNKPFKTFSFDKSETEKFSLIQKLQKDENKPLSKAQKKQQAIVNSGDFSDVKWFLNFGVGQQVSYNTAGDINKDSSEYFHKDLNQHVRKLSGNSGGFNIHSTATRRFGKNNMFNLEFGLQYSLRKEIIGLNESTTDIKLTDRNGKILSYVNSFGFFVLPPDTIKFILTESFAYVRRNTYSVFTIPVRFNVEQQLTPNTFASLGVGGGVSYIKGTSTGHYNLSRQNEMIVTNKQFTGSLNTMLSVYTNYNATVQLGFYTGYQMYLNKYNIANQYKLKMRDLQFGLTCKVPLGYK